MRAALYCRVSTEEQAREGVSLAAQRESLTAFCRSQGWQVENVYIDDGYSGKDLERPGMKSLLRDCDQGLCDVVLVHKLDRLTRSVLDLYSLLKIFDEKGIGFRSATEVFDTTSAMGRLFVTIVAAMAQWEREQTVERVQAGMEQVAREGRWHGSNRPPFGYTYTAGDKVLKIHPEHSLVVKQIFEWSAKGYGVEAIARMLNERGVTTPRGAKKWAYATVARMLKNPTYIGKTLHKYYADRILYEGQHEAIIPQDLWDQARAGIEDRRAKQKAPKRASLLSGICFCAECGGRMRSKKQWSNWPRKPKKEHRNYVCYNYLGQPQHMLTGECKAGYRHGPKVEQAVLEYIQNIAYDKDLIEQVAASRVDPGESEELRAALAVAENGLREVQRRISRWQEAFEEGLPLNEFRLRMQELSKKQNYWQEEILNLQDRQAEIAAGTLGADSLRQELQRVGPLIQDMEWDELWSFLHQLIDKVLVDSKNQVVKIEWA